MHILNVATLKKVHKCSARACYWVEKVKRSPFGHQIRGLPTNLLNWLEKQEPPIILQHSGKQEKNTGSSFLAPGSDNQSMCAVFSRTHNILMSLEKSGLVGKQGDCTSLGGFDLIMALPDVHMNYKDLHEQWKQKTSLDFLQTKRTMGIGVGGDEVPGPPTLSLKVHAFGTCGHPSGMQACPVHFLLQRSTSLQWLRMEQWHPLCLPWPGTSQGDTMVSRSQVNTQPTLKTLTGWYLSKGLPKPCSKLSSGQAASLLYQRDKKEQRLLWRRHIELVIDQLSQKPFCFVHRKDQNQSEAALCPYLSSNLSLP